MTLNVVLYVGYCGTNSRHCCILHLGIAFSRTFANETCHCGAVGEPYDLVVLLCHLECV